jgi:hypothetical protein
MFDRGAWSVLHASAHHHVVGRALGRFCSRARPPPRPPTPKSVQEQIGL